MEERQPLQPSHPEGRSVPPALQQRGDVRARRRLQTLAHPQREEDGRPREERRQQLSARAALEACADAALALDETSDVVAARAWVGLFAEALSDSLLFEKMRRLLDTEVASLERRSEGAFAAKDASALLAFILGSLVFGAFAPKKAAGFAAPAARKLVRALARK